MKTWQWSILVVVAIIVIVVGLAVFGLPAKAPTVSQSNTQATTTPGAKVASIPDLVIVSAPTIDAHVGSPLAVVGSARGNWYFEASFPVKLLDASGNTIAQGHGQAQGDWMTSDFVPFTASLTFSSQAAGSKGTLVLTNDNPSGDPAKQKVLQIPVVFK